MIVSRDDLPARGFQDGDQPDQVLACHHFVCHQAQPPGNAGLLQVRW